MRVRGAKPQAPWTPPETGAEDPSEPEEPVDESRLAELEYMRLAASRGWLLERKENVLRDFVRKTRQYPALVRFVKGLR